MTTVINNPSNNESTGIGMILGGILVLLAILGLFYYYGFPAFMEKMTTTWNPYLLTCNEEELKEIGEHAEAILNKAIECRRRL